MTMHFLARGAISTFLFAAVLPASLSAQDAMHPEPPSFVAEAEQAPRGRVYKERIEPHWFASNPLLDAPDRFWYRNDLADNRREFIVIDPEKPERAPAFDHARLAEALAKETKTDVTAERLPFDRIVFGPVEMKFQVGDQVWGYDPTANTLTKVDGPLPSEPVRSTDNEAQRRRGRDRAAARAQRSPDGKWTAFVKDHNLHLPQKTDGGLEVQAHR